jgi:hypothetical protein
MGEVSNITSIQRGVALLRLRGSALAGLASRNTTAARRPPWSW